jgi:hypothetical protein
MVPATRAPTKQAMGRSWKPYRMLLKTINSNAATSPESEAARLPALSTRLTATMRTIKVSHTNEVAAAETVAK